MHLARDAASYADAHREVRVRAALKGLRNSLVLNLVCPYLLYRALTPHFAAGSVVPLGISGLFPLTGLLWGLLRARTLDVIALFAAEDVLVSLAAAVLARTPAMMLALRSSQNAILGLMFLGSLLARRPWMLLIARPFVTGNDPLAVARFDLLATGLRGEDMRQVFRAMTLVWALTLIAKSMVTIAMALTLPPGRTLVLTPLVNYGSDVILVLWSFRYGYARLGHHLAASPATALQAADVQ